MAISDTSDAMRDAQFRVWSAMTGEQRLLLAFDMSTFAFKLMEAGIRREHPDWSEREVQRERLRRAFYPQPLPPGWA